MEIEIENEFSISEPNSKIKNKNHFSKSISSPLFILYKYYNKKLLKNQILIQSFALCKNIFAKIQ